MVYSLLISGDELMVRRILVFSHIRLAIDAVSEVIPYGICKGPPCVLHVSSRGQLVLGFGSKY